MPWSSDDRGGAVVAMHMRIVFADRHPVPRAAIAALVKEAAPGATVEEFDSIREALSRASGADLLLCGSSTGAVMGRRWIRQLVEAVQPGKLVVLGASQEQTICAEAHEAGAWAHIPMTSSAEVMIAALRLIIAGGVYFPALLPMRLTPDGLAADPAISMSRRQREVLALLDRGLSNRDIAARLEVSLPTAKLHVQGVFKKLGARNRTEAVRIAREKGLSAPS